MKTLEKSALKKTSSSEVFDSIIAEFKEGLENVQHKHCTKNEVFQ